LSPSFIFIYHTNIAHVKLKLELLFKKKAAAGDGGTSGGVPE